MIMLVFLCYLTNLEVRPESNVESNIGGKSAMDDCP